MEGKKTIRSPNRRKIEPIKDRKSIERIKALLDGNLRDLLLFDLATQTGIGMKQLLRLKAEDLMSYHVGDKIIYTGIKKQVKNVDIFMTETLYDTWRKYLIEIRPATEDFLFKSRKGNQPLTISSVSSMVHTWFQKAGLNGLSGTKSLQKTWATHFKKGSTMIEKSAQEDNSGSFMNPVKVETIKEKVYGEISRAIFSGRLAPGERLLEVKIAEQMNVSRMPVREALHRLQEAGFVSSFKKAGKVVNQLSPESLKEIVNIRIILESEAARMAVLKSNDRTIRRLEAIHENLVKEIEKNHIDEMLEFNRQFHFTFYENAGMPILQQMIIGLWDRVSPYVHILLREGDALASARDVLRNHQGMMDGIRKRDSEEVCKWLKADLIEGRDMVHNLFEKWGIN